MASFFDARKHYNDIICEIDGISFSTGLTYNLYIHFIIEVRDEQSEYFDPKKKKTIWVHAAMYI